VMRGAFWKKFQVHTTSMTPTIPMKKSIIVSQEKQSYLIGEASK